MSENKSDNISQEEDDGDCPECGACGFDGCCSALMCAHKNMVEKGCGRYCESYYWDLVVAYEVFKKLTEKHLEEIDYNTILDEVCKAREAHNIKKENRTG